MELKCTIEVGVESHLKHRSFHSPMRWWKWELRGINVAYQRASIWDGDGCAKCNVHTNNDGCVVAM